MALVSIRLTTNLTKLQTLDVSGNAFRGNPSRFLFQLPSVVSLNLADNHLSGNLPYNLSLAPSLVFLDLSSNLLSGALPRAFLFSSSTANNPAPHAMTIKYQNDCLNTTEQQQKDCSVLQQSNCRVCKRSWRTHCPSP
jgi:Leucine-rich repeat (LRR) protein